MKRHFKRHQLRIVMSSLFLLMALMAGLPLTVWAAKNKATTIRLAKTEGTVTITNSKMEEQVQTQDMRLYSGDHQITDEASYAWMNLDDTKAVKLDENSESEIRKKWKKLEVLLDSGSIFFNVTVPLQSDEALNIRSSTMITGIRGTCGWVRILDGNITRVYLLEGQLECLVTNPVEGGSEKITLKPGQYADFYVRDPEDPGKHTEIVAGKFDRDDIEPYVLVELIGDTPLVNKIYEQSGIDLRDLNASDVQKKLEDAQKAKEAENGKIRSKVTAQDGIVSKDPVWNEQVSGEADDSIVYLTMPQTAETVQKYLDMAKVKKVVLLPGKVSEEENTLKVDIVFQTPEEKTLEARNGVQVRVEKGFSFATNGTSLLRDVLTNYGTITVNSANTLRAYKTVYNHGLFDNTVKGRIVLSERIVSDGEFQTAGLIETEEGISGETLIQITGGSFTISDGKIATTQYQTVLDVKSDSKVVLNLGGGAISNDKEGGTTISVSTGDFMVDAMETDIMGITDTVFGEAVNPEEYGAVTVYRTDSRYHVVAKAKVESYQVILERTENGSLSAPDRVEVGATIPVQVTPADGYQLESLSVRMRDGGASVGVMEDHSFVMPKSDVIVSATFVKGDDKAGNKTKAEGMHDIIVSGENGTVKASVEEAKAGERIVLTLTPHVGHEFDKISVSAGNKTIVCSKTDDGYEFIMPDDNVTVTANFHAIQYTVTFFDADGSTVLSQKSYAYGTVPAYSGNTPKKGATKQFEYVFAGWKNAAGQSFGNDMPLPAVTGNDSYTAQYKESQFTYTVTWKNEDGRILKTETVTAGTVPYYGKNLPTKPKDAKYTYSFKAWTDEKSNYNLGSNLPEVTEDVTYRALYVGTINQYEVSFVDEDGTTVLRLPASYDYGTAGSMITKPAEPTKASSTKEEYTFAGWSDGTKVYASDSLPSVTGKVTYKATYTSTARKYTVTFVDDDGSVLRAGTAYAYGTAGANLTKPADPVKASTAQYDYTFAGWSDGKKVYAPGATLATVTSDTTYRATYTNKVKSYGVTFVDHDGTVLMAKKIYPFGTAVADIAKPADPTRAADGAYIYTFTGWTPAITAVSGDATYTATYSTENVIHVKSVSINEIKTGLNLAIGGTTTGVLSARVTPANATNPNVAWSVDDPTVLSISSSGDTATVTALKGGTAKVTVTSEDGLKTDSMTITVKTKVTGVSLDKTSDTIMLGKTDSLTATVIPADSTNKNVIWRGSDDSIATVEADAADPLKAVITPKKVGTVNAIVTTADGDFKASCAVTVKGYTVTFQNSDTAGTVLKTLTDLAYNATPSYGAGTPTKAATAQYTYTFDGWEDGANQYLLSAGASLPKVTGDATYTAVYAQTVNTYTVTWKNADGTILQTDTDIPYGTIITPADYHGVPPTKKGNSQYSYTFSTWSKTSEEVKSDLTITAQYTETINKYKITWNNWDGTALETDVDVPYGTAPSYDSTSPTRAASAEFTYAFAGWTDGTATYASDADVPVVFGNATYTATYSNTKNKYAITFQDDDGTVLLASAVYEYGTAAAAITRPTDPSKAADAQYTYTFKGWTPAVADVTGAVIYKADYSKTVNKYNVTFVDEDGTTVLLASAAYEYGTTAAGITKPTDPTKASTVEYDYTFGGWSPAVAQVTTDATYAATYNQTKRKYTVTFKNEGGTTLSEAQYEYGTLAADITVPANPTKAEDAQYTYTFADWDVALADVTGDATYTATYTATARSYSVTLDLNTPDGSGTITSGDVTSYTYGVGATLPTAVTRVGYRFDGWFSTASPAATDQPVTGIGTDVTGNKIFYAKWTAMYGVTVNSPSNGSIVPNATSVAGGDTVIVTVSATAGYELTSLTYSENANVAGTAITPDVNGVYSFTMPDSDVTLNAVFSPKDISGTLDITGTVKVGETLSAAVTGGNNVGTLSYQWQRDGVDLTGATSATYTLTHADYGAVISCIVTSSIETKSLTATTANAVGPAATVTLTVGTGAAAINASSLQALFDDDANSIVELKPGTNTANNVVTIEGTLTIPVGKTLVIYEGVTLSIGGGNISGNVVNLSKHSIRNSGIILVKDNGTLTNGSATEEGAIVNNAGAYILIMGTFENLGSSTVTVEEDGAIYYQQQIAGEDVSPYSATITASDEIKALMTPVKGGDACGGNVLYVFTKDTTNSTETATYYQVTFLGKGAVLDDVDDATIQGNTYCNYWFGNNPTGSASFVTKAVVSEGITALSRKQFARWDGLKEISLPSTVTEIPYGAFYGCTGLTTIEIPATITAIGESAFEGCSNLTTVTFHEGLATIGDRAFYNTGIVNLTLPTGLKSIGANAFYNDQKLLRMVSIPKSLQTLGNNVFENSDRFDNYAGITFQYDGTEDQWFKLKYENDWHTVTSDEYDPVENSSELVPVFTDDQYGNATLHKVRFKLIGNTHTVNPTFKDRITSGNTYPDEWEVPFGTWVYFDDFYPTDQWGNTSYGDYAEIFVRVCRVEDANASDENLKILSELYRIGFDAQRGRGAFMMPNTDAVVEVTYVPKGENKTLVKDEDELIQALEAGKPDISVATSDLWINQDLVVKEGTTLYLNRGNLRLGENTTLTIQAGAVVYNYGCLLLGEGATLVIEDGGTIYNYSFHTIENEGTIEIREGGVFQNGDGGENNGRLVNHDNGKIINRGIMDNAYGSLVVNDGLIESAESRSAVSDGFGSYLGNPEKLADAQNMETAESIEVAESMETVENMETADEALGADAARSDETEEAVKALEDNGTAENGDESENDEQQGDADQANDDGNTATKDMDEAEDDIFDEDALKAKPVIDEEEQEDSEKTQHEDADQVTLAWLKEDDGDE